jgi:hypothetical protein
MPPRAIAESVRISIGRAPLDSSADSVRGRRRRNSSTIDGGNFG